MHHKVFENEEIEIYLLLLVTIGTAEDKALNIENYVTIK
jgi:hypothetical protein